MPLKATKTANYSHSLEEQHKFEEKWTMTV